MQQKKKKLLEALSVTNITHTLEEVADMITDWFTDDDQSDEEKDNFGKCDIHQLPAKFRQSSRLLSSSSDSSKNRDKSDNFDAFSKIVTILGKDKAVVKSSSNSTVGRYLSRHINLYKRCHQASTIIHHICL